MSNKVLFGKKEFKYLIGYKDAKKNKSLCIFLSKMTAYRKELDETKCISFLIKDNELLEKYNEIWKNKLVILSKNNLIVIQFPLKNSWEPK